jgi:hypothetical protein
MSDSDYYNKFKDMVQVADQLGSDFGVHSEWVEAILVIEFHCKWSKDNIMVYCYGMQLQLVIRIVSYFLSLPLCLLCKDSPNVCPLPGAYG